MKFTVLGATGFIGRHLVNALRLAGHDVIAPARNDANWMNQALGHVIYCIGLTADFRTRPFDTFKAHISVLADVLEYANFESLLYLSSTRLYVGNISSAETSALSVNVNDPSDLYNISKMAGESLCLSCGRQSVRIARLSNVIGDDIGSTNFLFSLIRDALAGHIALQSDPTSAKDYIWVEDVIKLLPLIATSGNESIYNLASGINITHSALIERLVELTSCSVSICQDAKVHGFPIIDTARIRTEFDFHATSVLDQLPQLLNHFRKISG